MPLFKMGQWVRIIFYTGSALLSVLGNGSAQAKSLLIAQDESVSIYSGPGQNFRVLMQADPDVPLPVSAKKISNSWGTFYRVLVARKHGRKLIGFVDAKENVRIRVISPEIDDELDKYSELELSKQVFGVSFSYLRGNDYFPSITYAHFLSAGFFVRGYFGEFLTANALGHTFGLDVGNEALLTKHWSGYVAGGAGVMIPENNDDVFVGSHGHKANYVVRGSIGLKYNSTGLSSISLGPVQTALFSNDNSFVTFGGMISLEVGI
jgi:hypothetical protein